MGHLDPRAWFHLASSGALEVLGTVRDDVWDTHGLGDWTVRELAAHTMRAWSTVVTYLDEPLPVGDPLDAPTYFAESLVLPGVHEGVRDRARADAEELQDLVAAAHGRASAALARVAHESDDRLVPSRFGPLTLSEYLRTRAFELTVHGLDLVRATGVAAPEALSRSVAPAAQLALEVATRRTLDESVLLALTGREPLPTGFTVLG
jgi:uncharacterized protein (TIGR03083 family)